MKKNILILNFSPRTVNNLSKNEIIIPRNSGDIKVNTTSSCSLIQGRLLYYLNTNDNFEIEVFNVGNKVDFCSACYGCIKTGKCCKKDPLTEEIFPELEKCNILIIITPLYYGTIPAQLLAFFNRLYPYWIQSKDIDPKKGFPNKYPKPYVYTLATCADSFQDWELFDLTIKKIYTEIGWLNTDVFHFPAFKDDHFERFQEIADKMIKYHGIW